MKRAGFVVTILAASVGCKKKVDSADFEQRLTKRTEEIGLVGAKVSCPKDVAAKAGASFECNVDIGGKTYPLVATIKSAEGNDLQMDTAWKGGEAVLSAKLEPAVAAQLSEQLGTPVTLSCGEPLRFLDAKRNVSCDMSAGTTKAKAVMTFDAELSPTAWQLDPPLLAKSKLEATLTPSVREKTAATVNVDCGKDPLLVRPADGNVFCTIAGGDEQAKIRVSVDEGLKVTGWEAVNDGAPAAAPADGSAAD